MVGKARLMHVGTTVLLMGRAIVKTEKKMVSLCVGTLSLVLGIEHSEHSVSQRDLLLLKVKN